MLRIALVVLVLTGSASAYAQRSPDLATLDRGDGISRLGIDFGLTLLKKPPAPFGSVFRIEPYGQYIAPNGLGIYFAVPFARSTGAVAPVEDTTAVGNVDLGLLYIVDGSKRSSIVLRGGFALPLASDDDAGPQTNALGSFPRLTDLALALPEAYYIRLAASPLYHKNKWFLRGDLGVDIGFNGGGTKKAESLVRFNMGGGYDFGSVALGVELVNSASIDDFDNGEQFVHTLSASLRGMGKYVQPVFAIGTPLDSAARDNVKVYFTAGIQVIFRAVRGK